MHKDREERNRYMREYRARKKRTSLLKREDGVIREGGVITTSALTLGQFLREDLKFNYMPLDKFIEMTLSEDDPKRNKHITVYFKISGFCVAIPD